MKHLFRLSLSLLVGAISVVVALGLTTSPANAASLTQVSGFGSNPGALKMYSYLPAGLPTGAPLVIALHGCTQSATDYYSHSGWSKYADLYGFALVFAEQPGGSGLTAGCFDWGTTANDSRGKGQALSIYQMVQYAESHYGVNSSRIYITGLSAGGGMTANLLADYPDVFAAGAIDSGPPAQCTTAGITDSACTSTNRNNKTPAQWGALVRNSYPGYTGPWPRVAIWQGASDYLVLPVSMTESRDQWTNVWGISQTPSSTQTLPGGTTQAIYNDSSGKPAVETYSIAGMGHGLAVSPGSGTDQCGSTGAYYLSYICSSYYTAKFFGLDTTGASGLPAPTGLAVTATTTSSASLSWSTVSGAASYDVYRNGTLVNTAPVTATTYSDAGLAANTTYSYTVAAVSSTGTIGTRSAAVNATTTGSGSSALPAPTGLAVTATTSSSASLSWSTVSGAASYDVYRNGTLVNTAPVTGTTYTNTGLSANTTYSYTVAAVSSTGTIGTRSAAVNATTTAPLTNCWTTDNVSHNLAGRSYFIGNESYAIGSNQDMGVHSSNVISSVHQRSPGYWEVLPSC